MTDEEWRPVLQPIIVCAANRHADGTIVCGARHFDMIMRRQIDAQVETGLAKLPVIGKRIRHKRWIKWGQADQGFIDQFGRWYDRVTAGEIFFGQPLPLFSEDLY